MRALDITLLKVIVHKNKDSSQIFMIIDAVFIELNLFFAHFFLVLIDDMPFDTPPLSIWINVNN